MRQFIAFAVILLTLASCNKDKQFVYEVTDQTVYENSAQKQTEKTTTQFISIAYNDLFGANITSAELYTLDIALLSFGDKHVIEDMIIKNFLNRPGANVPTDAAMRADIPAFVNEGYLRFYNRAPTETEKWKVKDLIEKNSDITAQMVYYSMMTGEEYRYY